MSKRKRKKRADELDKKIIINNTLDLFNSNPTQAYNYKQISKRLRINEPSVKEQLVKVLREDGFA